LRSAAAKPSARGLETRQAILDAAADLFFACGYDAVSVDYVVARVSV
jgi:AcrR family transcriptional regulator